MEMTFPAKVDTYTISKQKCSNILFFKGSLDSGRDHGQNLALLVQMPIIPCTYNQAIKIYHPYVPHNHASCTESKH